MVLMPIFEIMGKEGVAQKNWSGRKNDQLISQVSPFHTGRQAGFPTYPNGPITIVQKQQALLDSEKYFIIKFTIFYNIEENPARGVIKKFFDTCLF